MAPAARRGLIVFVAAIVLMVGVFAVDHWWLRSGDGTGGLGVAIGGPFTLVDQNGVTRHDTDFRGELMLVYFGYTFCPDACPTALQTMTTALDDLGDSAKGVQPIFITVDPERDNNLLAEYVSAFHPSLIGLTGPPDEIRKVANSYKAFYTKAKDERTGEYTIDHAGVIYLMGRDGEYLGFMPPQTTPDRLTEVLRTYLAK